MSDQKSKLVEGRELYERLHGDGRDRGGQERTGGLAAGRDLYERLHSKKGTSA